MGKMGYPANIEEAIAKGKAGVGIKTVQGGVLCPYSFNTAWYWAWTGAFKAVHG